MGVGYPQIIHFHRIFPCKPAIMGGTSIYANPHMYHLFSGMLFFSIFFKVAIYMCAWIAEISGRNSDLPETKLGFSCCEGKGGPPSRSCNHSRFITQQKLVGSLMFDDVGSFRCSIFFETFFSADGSDSDGDLPWRFHPSTEVGHNHHLHCAGHYYGAGWAEIWPIVRDFRGRKPRRSQTQNTVGKCM